MNSTTTLADETYQPRADSPLHERIRLLTGATSWTLHPFPEANLRSLVLSDGPIGVRGVDEDERPSAQMPSPSAVAATWDVELVARLGELTAQEAKRKGVDVVLAPVLNLQRTPVGGRHFEAYSEDPFLTGVIATRLIAATQSFGVAMCAKHFLGNESETDRTTYIARIPEQALREVYLAPFERAVRVGHVWSVMSAYNQVDDGIQIAPATEHGSLINDLLKGEWGFDGVVVSDWLATNSTVASAIGGLDLVMPGPDGPWGQALEAAVAEGLIDESVIDDKVERVVRLGRRVGATLPAAAAVDENLPTDAATRHLLRETIARSTVVLRNNGTLPLSPSSTETIALIGPNAIEPFVQGGGSAFVTPPYASTPEAALRSALPNASITIHRGGAGRRHARAIDPDLVTTPDGRAGYSLTFLDEAGTPVGAPIVVPADEGWNRGAPESATSAHIEALVTLRTTGPHNIDVGVAGAHSVRFNGETVSESPTVADHDIILDSSANNPDGPVVRVDVGDAPRQVLIESTQQVVDAGAYGRFVRFVLRHDDVASDIDTEIDEAVAAARQADLAIVIVGTNEETESEGWDRSTLALPARQNELVDRVVAANPNTVVIVNAGAPVILPWLDRVAAVLWWWLPGQEAGNGLADALLGVTEPSGRLPWTLPADESDVPVPDGRPRDGVIEYSEGIHVGYRGWDKLGRKPAREFGFGLGYGTWRYDDLHVSGSPEGVQVRVTVTNTSTRDAREIVQVYLEAPGSSTDRPLRWLAGFTIADVGAGSSAVVDVDVDRRAFEIWNVDRHRWEIPDGAYVFHAGRSSRDLRQTIAAALKDQRFTFA
ncbi:beta-glucosidase [Leifsonia sp. YAF41]|uniref:beta-glucosidase n=1 Tax=Leifsonia sp. YAF41 TaxID=3233086 RepID=UPI003F9B128F